jgi:transposase
MAQEIRADHNQQWLFPPCLDDLLPGDHPARFVREFVDALNLEPLGFKMRKGPEGRPNYAADMLLKVWLYGYLERIRSTRKLEQACLQHVALVWLTGMKYPDHNSLWRFWNENRKAMKEVFRQTIQVAVKTGLISMALHAVDGTKITARASTDKMWGRKNLEKMLARVDKSLEKLEREVDRSEKAERGEESRLPEELADKQKLRETVRAKLAELDKEKREHMHPGERDARVMKNHEGTRLAYNGQAVADSKHGIVVAAEISTEVNDAHHLVPMLDKVQQELGSVAAETVADSGYWTGEQLQQAEKNNYAVIVSLDSAEARNKIGGDYNASKFTYDRSRDCVICPTGQVLQYRKTQYKDGKEQSRVYRSECCGACPVREHCTKDKKGRSIRISPYRDSFLRQRQKLQNETNRKLLRQRSRIIEPVFAVVKELFGFRRWSFGGLQKVQSQWSFVCALVNLKRMYPMWRRGELQFT